MSKKITVVQTENEVPYEILAQSIQELSDGMKKIRTTKLNDRCVLVLLNDITGLPKKDIKAVMEGIESLERTYLKSKNVK